jgi:AmmeMemoRadiSam system protein A
MKVPFRILLGVLVLAALGGCRGEGTATEPQGKPKRVLGPAVAGKFYPQDKEALAKKVDELLAAAKAEPIENLRALVCPHAGYEFSGGVAAKGFKQLAGRKFRTVIILGPSHTSLFHGVAVADADAVETPLGQIPISPKAAELGGLPPFSLHPKCEVFRPDWWQSAPKQLPAFGEETPLTWEHSVEVEYPFLQRMLTDFSVVPAVCGDVEPEEAAEAVLKVLDDDTLLVASSDLTHYIPYDLARSLDKTTTQAIAGLSIDWLEAEEDGWMTQTNNRVSLACGIKPILTVMHVAKRKGWKAKLLEYRHSSDVTGTGKTPGVGYAAVAFYAPSPSDRGPATKALPRGQAEFTPPERKLLLELARRAVAAAAEGKEAAEPDRKALPEKFSDPRACFVTLTKDRQLRGCIGSIFPREPLYQAVLHAGHSAAVEDHRFAPVAPAELKNIEIEVSILTVPERLKTRSPEDLLAKLRPDVDGVVLRVDRHQGLFLPQVWKQLPDKEQFLNHLAEDKAGVAPSAWRRADARILVFQVEAFEEAK